VAFLVVRIRGIINVPFWAADTLRFLHLEKRFSATIVPETTNFIGMLKKVKDWVAWTKIDEETLKVLIAKRGQRQDIPNVGSDPKQNLDLLASDVVNEKVAFFDQKILKPFFPLNSPKGGFKRIIKRQYSDGGILGNNKELIDVVRRMI
jgi:large subunit ribosomal protein L30